MLRHTTWAENLTTVANRNTVLTYKAIPGLASVGFTCRDRAACNHLSRLLGCAIFMASTFKHAVCVSAYYARNVTPKLWQRMRDGLSNKCAQRGIVWALSTFSHFLRAYKHFFSQEKFTCGFSFFCAMYDFLTLKLNVLLQMPFSGLCRSKHKSWRFAKWSAVWSTTRFMAPLIQMY
jgi:hypothetical protein